MVASARNMTTNDDTYITYCHKLIVSTFSYLHNTIEDFLHASNKTDVLLV